MIAILKDIRYAGRQLRRSPGFALTAVLTLALGVGANTAMYVIVRNTLLRPLPYPQQQRLVGINLDQPNGLANDEQTGESANFIAEHSRSFASVGVQDDGALNQNLSVSGDAPQTVKSLRVSAGYLPTLGVAPLKGRTFLKDEDRAGGAPVAVISEPLWRGALGADPQVIGRVIHLNADPFTVIGVMPAALTTVDAPDVWQPLRLSSADPGFDGDNFQMIARLRDGVSVAQASAELAALNAAFFRAYPKYERWTKPGAPRLQLAVFPLRAVVSSQAKASVLTLAAAAAAVLLMVCLNLAGLLIARSAARRKEVAVRVALGAGRATLLRMLLLENLLLAVAGSALGVVLAGFLVPYLLHASPITLPQLHGFGIDAATMAFAFGLGVLTVAVFGLLPSLRSLRGFFALSAGTRIAGDGVEQQRLNKVLLVSQVAITTILLSVGSLLLGTFLNMRSLHTGVDVQGLYAAQVNLRGNRYKSAATTEQFLTSVLLRLQVTPGVAQVAAVNGLPLDRGLNNGGYPTAHPEMRGVVESRFTTPGYFATAGTRLLLGRDFTGADNKTAMPVALINQQAAMRWFRGRSAVGEFVTTGGVSHRVVGIIADARGSGIADRIEPTVYLPYAQTTDETTTAINGWFPTTFVLRSGKDADAQALLKSVADAIATADPEVPLGSLSSMQHFVDKSVAAPRFFSWLALAFAGFAVMLTLVGLFGLLSYQVTARRREFGVRMALESHRSGVLLLVLRRGLGLTALGLMVGAAGSLMLRQSIRAVVSESIHLSLSSLAGVLASSGVAFATAAATMLLAATCASFLPAIRAAHIQPMEALRGE